MGLLYFNPVRNGCGYCGLFSGGYVAVYGLYSLLYLRSMVECANEVFFRMIMLLSSIISHVNRMKHILRGECKVIGCLIRDLKLQRAVFVVLAEL